MTLRAEILEVFHVDCLTLTIAQIWGFHRRVVDALERNGVRETDFVTASARDQERLERNE